MLVGMASVHELRPQRRVVHDRVPRVRNISPAKAASKIFSF
jgi:hypothetical protein